MIEPEAAVDEARLDESQRRTLAIFRQLVAQRDRQIAERAARAANGEQLTAPTVRRIRFSTDPKTGKAAIDLTRADPGCPRCGGSGRLADEVLEDPTRGRVEIPVVCACVHRRGGVARDALDRMISRAEKLAARAGGSARPRGATGSRRRKLRRRLKTR